MKSPVRIMRPGIAAACVVADSPHSGRHYPADFNYNCSLENLRLAEDPYVDQLFDFFPELGVPFLAAEFPRSYIDPNRPDDVTDAFGRDPEGNYVLARSKLVRDICSPRCRAPIYDRQLSLKEVFNRFSTCYAPYHAALDRLIGETAAEQGKVVHLNMHSMPSMLRNGTYEAACDILIGTRHGTTVAPELVAALRRSLEEKGFVVGVDRKGFEGNELVRRNGDPAHGRHSIQIEINRKLYVNEETLELRPEMALLKQKLREALASFVDFCRDFPPPGKSPALPVTAPSAG